MKIVFKLAGILGLVGALMRAPPASGDEFRAGSEDFGADTSFL